MSACRGDPEPRSLLSFLEEFRNGEDNSEALRQWITENEVQINGLDVRKLGANLGNGLVATKTISVDAEDEVMVAVPRNLMLNLDYVEAQAAKDQYLCEVLEAYALYSSAELSSINIRSIDTRTAVLIFLLVEFTKLSTSGKSIFGAAEDAHKNAWTFYLQNCIPDDRGMCTRWTEEERQCLWGTSLARLANNKVAALKREFAAIRDATIDLSWCQDCWWSSSSQCLTFDDFMFVEAAWRSRAMDLQEKDIDGNDKGECLVPIMDMANHDDEDSYIVKWGTFNSDKPQLSLEFGRHVQDGYEVTITYGTHRTSADFLLNYGFVEDRPHSGGIDLFLPGDNDIITLDPWAQEKALLLQLQPVIHIRVNDGEINTESHALYAFITRPDDGLNVEMPENDDDSPLFTIDGKAVHNSTEFMEALKESKNWAWLSLRYYRVLEEFLKENLNERPQMQSRVLGEKLPDSVVANSHAYTMSEKLRGQETALLEMAVEFCSTQIMGLEHFEPPLDDSDPEHQAAMVQNWENEDVNTNYSNSNKDVEWQSNSSIEEVDDEAKNCYVPTTEEPGMRACTGDSGWKPWSESQIDLTRWTIVTKISEEPEPERRLPGSDIPRMRFTKQDKERARAIVKEEMLQEKIKELTV